MSDFTFLHAADLHLDTPFEGLGALRPEIAAALRDASLAAWDRLVELALERRVALVLLAGDLYDGPERGIRAQLRFRRGLERLAAAGVRVFVVHGNHDPLEEGWSALRDLPPGVTVFDPGAPQAEEVVAGGRRIAVVHGVSYGQRAERENLAARFRRTSDPLPQFGLLHCNVEGQAGHDPYAPCTLADLRAAGMDYWALGHVHQRQVLARAPGWVVYPGNLQGRSHKPSEQGAKGVVIGTVRCGAVRELEFVPLAPVRFETVRIDIASVQELAKLEQALLAEVRQWVGLPGLEGLLVRVELVGRGPLHLDLARGVDGLAEALQDATAGTAPWVCWERIVVRTGQPIDRAALLARDDFAGELLRRLDVLRADEATLERLLAEVDEGLLRGEIARVVGPASEEERRLLLEAAETLAIDRFGGEA